MNKLVSVIVPVYNGEKYIGECIRSLLNQSYKIFELIIVDDGSSDKTKAVVEQYQNSDKRIQYIYQVHKGVGAARNTGIDNSNGEYLCFVDSDDIVSSDYIKKQYVNMVDSVDIVISGMEVTQKGKETIYIIPSYEKVPASVGSKNILEGKYGSGFVVNKLFRTDLFSKFNIRFKENLLYEDLLISYELFSKARMVCYIDEVLYHYQRRDHSLCTTYENPNRIIDLLKVLSYFEKYTTKEEKRSQSYKLFLYDQLFRMVNYYLRANSNENLLVFEDNAKKLIDLINKYK